MNTVRETPGMSYGSSDEAEPDPHRTPTGVSVTSQHNGSDAGLITSAQRLATWKNYLNCTSPLLQSSAAAEVFTA